MAVEAKDVRSMSILAEGFTGEKKAFIADPWAEIYGALKNGLILQGRVMGVERSNGEDALVLWFGDVKGVIPESEVGDSRAQRLSAMVGTRVAFKVVKGDREAGVVYLSRKDALEELAGVTWRELTTQHGEFVELRKRLADNVKAQREARVSGDVERLGALEAEGKEIRRSLREKAPVRTCTVRWVGEEGAIVDIGGVTAYLPRNEISHSPVADARDVLKVGDSFDVKVIDFNSETGRVRVSLRSMLPDPWETRAKNIRVGGAYLGTVKRYTDSGKGMIVQFEGGLQAWVKAPPKPPVGLVTVPEVLNPPVGSEVVVSIYKVDPVQRRIYGRIRRRRTG